MRQILTARDGPYRLTEVAPVPAAAGEGLAAVRVAAGSPCQSIAGFGGAFTEAAAVTWGRLGGPRRQEFLRAYFDPREGHGYTLCRVPMGSCDFALGNYSHLETPGDTALASFSIARDEAALVPFIQAAQARAGAPLKLLASPWSPPAWMKTNGEMNHGGRLRPEFRAAWAQCFVRFIQAYAAHGLAVWAVTVQNEPAASQPWDSCLYTAEEERDFVRDFLGPALAQAGLGNVRILIWDHNRDLMYERSRVVYADPQAARYVWGTGFHWYGEDSFDQVQRVHDAWPGKHLLFTEGCQEGGPHLGAWELGERYARSLIHDLNRWTEGWIDWNLALDLQGGPNHVGNYCSAPILVDPAGDALLRQSSYYYLGHFTRFARPGARRLPCACEDPALEATAFADPDGSVAVVVLNRTEDLRRFDLRIDGAPAAATGLPPRSIATYLSGPS